MNKVKIKEWVKNHKYEIIGGIALFVSYKYGIRKGKKKQKRICEMNNAKLGNYKFIDIGGEYSIKDLGKLGMDSLKAAGCPETLDKSTKINAIMYFYDI